MPLPWPTFALPFLSGVWHTRRDGCSPDAPCHAHRYPRRREPFPPSPPTGLSTLAFPTKCGGCISSRRLNMVGPTRTEASQRKSLTGSRRKTGFREGIGQFVAWYLEYSSQNRKGPAQSQAPALCLRRCRHRRR
jgi:hypothetical protein